MRKKSRLALGVFTLTTALALSACSAQPAVKDEETSLTVAQVAAVETMDPAMHRARITQTVVRNVFEALVNQDNELAPVPELATEWEQVDDLTWRFTLREGVTFHNGEEFTADAVKYSIDRVLDPEQASPRASMLSMIVSVEVEDEFTVVITTAAPAPTLLASLAVNEIVPPAYVEEVGDAEFAARPVGTGPFTFVSSSDSGSRVILEANEDYWGGAPTVDRLVFEAIPEVSSRVAALQSGAVDIAASIPADLAATLSGRTTSASVTGTRISFLAMNTLGGPFADPAVRQAMNKAIDKDAIIEGLYLGFAISLNQPAFPQMVGYNTSYKGYKYDQDAAAKVLTGVSESITIDAEEEDRLLAEAIAGQLQEAGLTASVRVLESLAFDESVAAGASQAYISSWGVAEGDADVILARHFWTQTRPGNVFTGYSNLAVDELIVAGRSTLDEKERTAIYADAIELIMEDAPWVPLLTAEEIYGVSTGVEGWEPSPIGRINAKTVTVK